MPTNEAAPQSESLQSFRTSPFATGKASALVDLNGSISARVTRRRRPQRLEGYDGQAESAARIENPASFFWLDESMGWRFPQQPAERTEPLVEGQNILAQCVSCNTLVLPTPEAIAMHEKSHGKTGKLICGHNKCTHTFSCPRLRTEHIKDSHSIISEQYCPFCKNNSIRQHSRSFSTSLAEHIFKAHFHIENWQCSICHTQTETLWNLYNHYARNRETHPTQPEQIRDEFIDKATGLPLNAHYLEKNGVNKIVAFPNGKPPQIPNPVDWSRPNPTR